MSMSNALRDYELNGFNGYPSTLCIGSEIDWPPAHLTGGPWLEHIPLAFWIMKVLRPRCLVELGTERGASYTALCHAVESLGLDTSCYAVDTWKGTAAMQTPPMPASAN
jgi:hypothetical protein